MLTSGETPFAVGRRNRKQEGWQSGLMHLTANEASRKASEVRILHPLQFYRDMEQQNTIENSVASAILEKSIDNIDIEGVTYEIAPPSTATLILISEIVATLPVVKKVPAEEIVTSVLHYARYYRPIGDIAAVLILGAKNLIEYRTIVQEKRYLFGLIRRKTETTIKVDKKAELAKIILENVSPTTLFNVVVQRLQDMEIGSFFAITTSLSEANILKPTKEVVKD